MIVRTIAAALLASALLAAGCGRSDEREVRETLEAFAEATARKDFQRLCDDIFSTELVEEVRRHIPCEVALRRSDLGAARDPKLVVRRVRVEGDVATADVSTSAANQPPSQDTVKLVREGESWRIQALSS